MTDRVAFGDFLSRFRWAQGEHVSLIGHTGCGKTTLALALLDRRRYRCVIGTKPADATLSKLLRPPHNYRRIAAWPPPSRQDERIVLWPKLDSIAAMRSAPAVYQDALEAMFVERNWCLFADETAWLARDGGCTDHLRHWWEQGRSIGLSLVAATQRPAWVPLHIYSQATHLFLWRENDTANLKRLGGLDGGLDPKAIRAEVARLRYHDFLYLNTRTGDRCVSRVERLTNGSASHDHRAGRRTRSGVPDRG